jgi:lysophospholipase L1-like esterase
MRTRPTSILFLGIFLAVSPAAAPAQADRPDFVLCCAGDSLMRPQPVHLRILFEQAGGRPFRVEDWSQGGQSSQTYPSFLRAREEGWKNTQPDFLILQLGTNDAGPIAAGTYGRPRFEENLKGILRSLKILAGRPDSPPRLFIATVPLFLESPNSAAKNRAITDVINPTIRAVAEETGAVLVDQFAVLENRPDLYDSDGAHPSGEGEKALARNWLRALMKARTTAIRGPHLPGFPPRLEHRSSTRRLENPAGTR